MDADLVELAGAEALVERARQRFDAGEREAALHLLDTVLEVDPGMEAARKLAAQVHRSLLDDSENFWLSSWLERQVALLSSAPGEVGA